MVKNKLFKNSLSKLKRNYSRFLSLLVIIAVGTAFFTGINASSPDINSSTDSWYDQNSFMDFKLASTMGFTNEDVEAIRNLEGTELVVPSYSMDYISDGRTIRVHALETNINKPNLKKGRLPVRENECLADSRNYKVGDKIILEEGSNDILKEKSYKVTGTVDSVLYLFKDYGITSLGNGKIHSYIFIPKENFTSPYYTEIFIKADNATEAMIYSDEYKEITGSLENKLSAIKGQREKIGFETFLSTYREKLDKAEKELTAEKEKGLLQLQAAKSELDKGYINLQKGRSLLKSSQLLLDKTIVEKEKEFAAGKKNIEDGRKSLLAELLAMGITESQLSASITEDQNKLATLDSTSQEYADLVKLIEAKVLVQESLSSLKQQETIIDQGIATFNSEIEKSRTELNKQYSLLNENQEKISKGYREYYSNLALFNKKIEDGETRLKKERSSLEEIKKPEWYILDRNDFPGYASLREDTRKVTLIAGILPLFFILIVALMSQNTMTRMIEEERGEIGTLTSLGYSRRQILSTYIIYVTVASLAGIMSGFFIGSYLIPYIIYTTYAANYLLPKLIIGYDYKTLILATLLTLALMTGVTIKAGMKELKEKPAQLMRPAPLKKGKTILLERATFIWQRLSFTWKVTMRNIFRYKKRVYMTIIGIAGCTALLLTGFGIKDSISGISNRQYNDILHYDSLIILKNPEKQLDQDLSEILNAQQIKEPLLLRQETYTSKISDKELEVSLIVPENEKKLERYFKLKDMKSHKKIELEEDSVVITRKLSELTEKVKGDFIDITDSKGEKHRIKITAVADNYVQHYIYMGRSSYAEYIGENDGYNIIASSHDSKDQSLMAENLLKDGRIAAVNFTTDNLKTFNGLLASLNNIIVMIIAFASVLALMVLFNLTSINISERKREIATLKVLGFQDGEVSNYIYRETFLLTLISIVTGLVGGIFLHRLVIGIIEVDSTVFQRNIDPLSFLYCFLITIFFTVVIQIWTFNKLKKIDMIDSLKSVE